jgi:hypothetical protein
MPAGRLFVVFPPGIDVADSPVRKKTAFQDHRLSFTVPEWFVRRRRVLSPVCGVGSSILHYYHSPFV